MSGGWGYISCKLMQNNSMTLFQDIEEWYEQRSEADKQPMFYRTYGIDHSDGIDYVRYYAAEYRLRAKRWSVTVKESRSLTATFKKLSEGIFVEKTKTYVSVAAFAADFDEFFQ